MSSDRSRSQKPLLAAALGACALLAIYGYAALALPGDADLMRHSSGIYDMDVPRVVANVTTRLRAFRTEVHPLQKLLVAPLGHFVNVRIFGGSAPLAAAKVMIATSMTLNALLVGVLAWRLARRSLLAGILAGAICGLSFSSLLAASVPESAAFSCLATVVPLVLLNARAEKPFTWGEAVAWAGVGVLGFGITITQVTHGVIALVVRLTALRGEQRKAANVASLLRAGLVLALAALAIWSGAHLQEALYPRSRLFWERSPVESERRYMRIDDLVQRPLHHTAGLLSHFTVYSFLAPAPAFSDYLIREFGIHYWSLSIEESDWGDWRPAPRALAGIFLLASLGACAFLGRADVRFLAPALSVASQFGIHLLYGREYVLYSPNWHGVLVAVLVAAAWNGLSRRRNVLAIGGAVLCVAMLVNNLAVLQEVYREFSAGLEVERRDATGALLER